MGFYNSPSGDLDAEVVHLLNWCPESGQKPFAEILDAVKSPSIKLLRAIFPDISKHLVLDLWAKREKMTILQDGVKIRRSNDEIYGQNPRRVHHEQLVHDMITSSKAHTIIVYGLHAKDFILRTFGKPGESHLSHVLDKRVLFIHHPEYLIRWASISRIEDSVARLLGLGNILIRVEPFFALRHEATEKDITEHEAMVLEAKDSMTVDDLGSLAEKKLHWSQKAGVDPARVAVWKDDLSKRMKRQWQDDGYRKKISEAASTHLKQQWQDDDYRKKKSEATSTRLKQQWQDDDYRKKKSEEASTRLTQQWQDDDFRKKISEAASIRLTQQWQDDDYRKKTSEATSTRLKQQWQDDDYRKKKSEQASTQMKQQWQDDDYRKKKSEEASTQMTQQWQDDDFRKKRLEAMSTQMTQQWQDEEYRKNRSESSKLLWQDEDYRKKVSDGIKKRREEKSSRISKAVPSKKPRGLPVADKCKRCKWGKYKCVRVDGQEKCERCERLGKVCKEQ